MALLGKWLGPVRLAMHAAIRRLANRKRQKLVREFTLKLIAEDSHLKGWASITGWDTFRLCRRIGMCLMLWQQERC